MSEDDSTAIAGVCVECEQPIEDVSERTIVGEEPKDPYDREDNGSVEVAHVGCVE